MRNQSERKNHVRFSVVEGKLDFSPNAVMGRAVTHIVFSSLQPRCHAKFCKAHSLFHSYLAYVHL